MKSEIRFGDGIPKRPAVVCEIIYPEELLD